MDQKKLGLIYLPIDNPIHIKTLYGVTSMISFLVFLLFVIQNIRGIYSKRLKSEVQFCFQSDIWKDFFARNHQRKLFNLYHDLCKKRQRGRVRKSRQKHIKYLKTKGLFP